MLTDPSSEYPVQEGETIWVNSRYQVYMRRFGEPPNVLVHLSIKRRDKREIRDWRDFQRIKNELVGPEAEAIEIFPAESRLVDTANQYHLWVFPYLRIPFGFDSGRFVSEANIGSARQRPWDDDNRPGDLADPDDVKRRLLRFLAPRKGEQT